MAYGGDDGGIPEGLTFAKSVDEFKEQESSSIKAFQNQLKSLEATFKETAAWEKSWSIKSSKSELAFAEKAYKEELASLNQQIKRLRDSNASEEEILAWVKKNGTSYAQSLQDLQTAMGGVKNDIDSIVKETRKDSKISAKTRRDARKQLELMEKNASFAKIYETKQQEIMGIMNRELEKLRLESEEQRRETQLRNMLEDAHRLEDKKFEREREKRSERLEKKRAKEDKKADNKASLLASIPVVSLISMAASPFVKAVTGKDPQEFFSDKFQEKLTNRRKIEDENISEKDSREDKLRDIDRSLRSKQDDLFIETQKKLDAESGGEAALLPVFEQRLRNKEKQKKAFSDYEKKISKEDKRKERLDELVKGMPSPLRGAVDLFSNKSSKDEEVQEEFITDLIDAEYNPLLEKTAPNQNALLAKGGILGASAVYLGKLLGDQLDDMTEGQDKKKGEGGFLESAKSFLSKNGLSLMKLAAPLAVMAIGGVMIKKGLDMQQRDTDDAKKYFEEGNTARGIETAWLGDRARLTEENANSELGRTTGKTALLAGGAATVGVGAAGAIAGGAALAGGAGLAGAGSAAMAGMAAAFPPALIAAAVAVGVTVIAKGTQEAFELGWDKNQASIQKELNSVIFDEDASLWDKIKAGAESTWKGFTGALAGGIREAGSVLDAETMIQNEKQIKFLQEQADAGNEDYARLLDLMQSEQFKAMNENEQKMLMQSEGLYDDYGKMQQETQKSFGEHLLTAGRTVGGFFTGLVDTAMEGARGRETAKWEAEALKGMENMSGEDVARLKKSQEYQDAMANGGSAKDAMEAAYLKEQKDTAIARGDLTKDGMAIQRGGGIQGAAAGFAAGGLPGAIVGGIAGDRLGKYFGMGDTGLAYKQRKTGTDELDNEYRQTFEYSKRKFELMSEGKSAEEADLAVIAEQNQLYQDSLTLRLKQSDDYKETFDKVLKETGDIKKAEEAGLKAARENKKNTMTTTQLMKAKFTEVWDSVKDFAGNVGGWFKDKFSAAGQGLADLGKAIADGAASVWNSVTEWASGLWKGIGEKFTKVLDGLKDFGSGIMDAGKAGLDWLGNKASGAFDWLTGGGRQADAAINDGIVTKEGKVIELSPDDNVYATKNEPRVVRDQEAQAAMPSIQKTPAEFTDKNIVTMLQAILDRLNKMDVQPQIITRGGDVNFDSLKMAGAL